MAYGIPGTVNKLNYFLYRVNSVIIPQSGHKRAHTTSRVGWLDSMIKKPNFRATGAHHSGRYVWGYEGGSSDKRYPPWARGDFSAIPDCRRCVPENFSWAGDVEITDRRLIPATELQRRRIRRPREILHCVQSAYWYNEQQRAGVHNAGFLDWFRRWGISARKQYLWQCHRLLPRQWQTKHWGHGIHPSSLTPF